MQKIVPLSLIESLIERNSTQDSQESISKNWELQSPPNILVTKPSPKEWLQHKSHSLFSLFNWRSRYYTQFRKSEFAQLSGSFEIHFDRLSGRISSIISNRFDVNSLLLNNNQLRIYDIIEPSTLESRFLKTDKGKNFPLLATKESYKVNIICSNKEKIPALISKVNRPSKNKIIRATPQIELLFANHPTLNNYKKVLASVNNENRIINIDLLFWSNLGYSEEPNIFSKSFFLDSFIAPSDRDKLKIFLEIPPSPQQSLVNNISINLLKKDKSTLSCLISKTSFTNRELCIGFPIIDKISLFTAEELSLTRMRADHILMGTAAELDALIKSHYQNSSINNQITNQEYELRDLHKRLLSQARKFSRREPILPSEVSKDSSFKIDFFFKEFHQNLTFLIQKNLIGLNIKIKIENPGDFLDIIGSKTIFREVIGHLVFQHFTDMKKGDTLTIEVKKSQEDINRIIIRLSSPYQISLLKAFPLDFISGFKNQFSEISTSNCLYLATETMQGSLKIKESADPNSFEYLSYFSFPFNWGLNPKSDLRPLISSKLSSNSLSEQFKISEIESAHYSLNLTPISHKQSPNSSEMLAQILANSYEDIISIDKASISLEKDEVIDCVEFPNVCGKCGLGKKTSLPILRILYAEDTDSISKITLSQLKKLGQTVIHVKTGSQAFEELFSKQRDFYDLGIFDIHMPDGNGDEIVAKARKVGIKTPIVALTGNTSQIEISQYINKGIDQVYQKPVNLKMLEEIILTHGVEKSSTEPIPITF
jgi:CheY-like chemotaxis protein